MDDSVYRAKGLLRFADTPQQGWVFQLVGKRLSLEPHDVGVSSTTSQLVLITRQGQVDHTALRQQLDACLIT
ncbi:MAG: GTP-binding protein [Candidatus Tectomicrobia bacterium]